MTRKDYVAIANALRNTRPSNIHTPAGATDPGCGLWKQIREELTIVLAEDNPNFKRGVFLVATEA